MNLVQVKTNIHDFERCERDVILFILDYMTEKYTHRGRGGGISASAFDQESEA